MQLANWLDWRREAGASSDRSALLALMCEASGYRPTPWQVRAHLAHQAFAGDTMHKLIIGGVGSGKTMWAAAELMLCVLANPGGWFLVGEPTYDQVTGVAIPAWTRLCEAMAATGYRVSRKGVAVSTLIDELACGGRVYFRSYSKVDRLLGFSFAGVWMDEVETVANPARVWEALAGRVRQSGVAWRQIYASSTPRGLAGVVEKFAVARARASTDPRERQRWYWQRVTPFENPHLPEGFIDSLRSGYSQRQWRQEVMAEILKPETAIWSEFDFSRHGIPYRYDPALPYDIAVDWGDSWPHVLWIQFTASGAVIFDEFCDDAGMDVVRERILEGVRTLRRPPEYLVGDRAVKSEMAWAIHTLRSTQVRRMRTRAEQSVAEGIESVRALLDPVSGPPRLFVAEHLARDPPKRGIVRCLQNYRYRSRADGTVSPDPYKDNVYDHGADALRMWSVCRFGEAGTLSVVARHY